MPALLLLYYRLVKLYYLYILSRDSHTLTSLRVLTFLTHTYVRPETPTHVPLQPLFIPIPNLFYFCIQMSLYQPRIVTRT